MARIVRSAVMVATLLAGGACAGSSDGGVVVLDSRYSVETLATEADGIASPDGLTWHAGSLYVADEGGSAIRRLGSRGWETLADRRSGIKSPEDIAVSADGTVFFTDDSAGGLWAARDGRAARVAKDQFGNLPTEGLAIGPGGELLVGNPGKRRVDIALASPEGLPGAVARTLIAKAESIAVDPAGTIWVADNEDDVLYRFDAGSRGPARMRWPGVSPESIARIGSALWITDSHNGKLYRLRRDGRIETVAVFAGKLNNVSGVTGGPGGSVYVSIQTDLDADEGTIVVLRKRRSMAVTPAG